MQQKNNLESIVDAIKIVSQEAFSFAGKTFNVNTNIFQQTPGTTTANPLVKLLTEVIYEQCYCREFNGAYYQSKNIKEDNGTFQQALSQANSTIERWDSDWIVDQILPTGQYLTRKNYKYKILYPGQFITAEYQSTLPQAGSRITVHCMKEALGLQPAFYFAFSKEMNDEQSLYTIVRFYWNVQSSGASKLIELLTRNLNKYSIPFSFKCLNKSSLFTRSDAAVLYVSKPYYHIVSQILGDVYPKIKDELNVQVPLFTKQLGPGFGLAEDPGTGESFGMSRCAAVAQGIYNAYQSGLITNKEKMDQIELHFQTKGIQINKPYLNVASSDIYEFTY